MYRRVTLGAGPLQGHWWLTNNTSIPRLMAYLTASQSPGRVAWSEVDCMLKRLGEAHA